MLYVSSRSLINVVVDLFWELGFPFVQVLDLDCELVIYHLVLDFLLYKSGLHRICDQACEWTVGPAWLVSFWNHLFDSFYVFLLNRFFS
jgi:hypothetical protein